MKAPGGVANYYNALKLQQEDNIQYFSVNKNISQSAVSTLFRLLKKYCKFSWLILRKRIDIVHVNPSLDRRSFYRDAVFILISRVFRRNILVFFRGWLDEYEEKIKKNKIRLFIFRLSYGKANAFIVLSELFKRKLIEIGVTKKARFFIESTVADNTFLHCLNLKKKQKEYVKNINFLFLSRIERTKGVYIAVDAYNKFVKDFPGRNSCLIIAGDGPELIAVKQYTEENKIPHVQFPGFVSGQEKRNILLDSHIMILPSYSEGLPNTVLEGMIYGMPIISRTTGGIPDVVKQGVNGYLSDSLNSETYSDFMKILAFDENLYNRISRTNHETALENFTTEKIRDRILRIYQSFKEPHS